jgi:hypothetical protein
MTISIVNGKKVITTWRSAVERDGGDLNISTASY